MKNYSQVQWIKPRPCMGPDRVDEEEWGTENNSNISCLGDERNWYC
jgi:hypothetical protein